MSLSLIFLSCSFVSFVGQTVSFWMNLARLGFILNKIMAGAGIVIHSVNAF